jgi:predicted metalloprotease with PDZ domain
MVTVTITPGRTLTGAVDFIMPRSVPGAYSVIKYDLFVREVMAEDGTGRKFNLEKNQDDGPRWHLDSGLGVMKSIHYRVDLDAMEDRLSSPSDASIVRKDFVGMLNYSVLGWIDGMDDLPVFCDIQAPPGWPVFSTLSPSATPPLGMVQVKAPSYHVLADAQTYLGHGFRVAYHAFDVPLYIASYTEGSDEYLEDYAWQERWAMGTLKQYFGDLPFPYYSLMLRRSIPKKPLAAPPLAMEHLQSSTFFSDTSAVRKRPMSEDQRLRTLSTYLHHMGHAFIPLRAFGDAYRPRMMEAPPIIDDIWLNEGFMWWLCYDTLKLPAMMKRFQDNVYHAPAFIRNLDLFSLSRLASTQYGEDFRIGQAVFSRGALMADEMDRYIKERTQGKRSMRDVLRYLYNWHQKNQRPFTMEEFPSLLREATGVDLDGIFQRWKLPVR